MLSRLALISAVVGLSLFGGSARAQDDASSEADEEVRGVEDAEAEAQQYFMEARSAFDEQRYADARRLLDQSLSLAPRPATAINLARVLRSLGEQLEIIRTLEALLEGRYGEVSDERRPEAHELMAEARQALSHIVVSARGEDSVAVRVDGIQMNELSDGASYEQALDPGQHVVVGVTDDGRLREVALDLGPGERREVALSFPERVEEAAGPSESSSGTSPWVWVAAVGGALAIGAVVLAIVLATSGGGATTAAAVGDPQGVFPIIEALSW